MKKTILSAAVLLMLVFLIPALAVPATDIVPNPAAPGNLGSQTNQFPNAWASNLNAQVISFADGSKQNSKGASPTEATNIANQAAADATNTSAMITDNKIAVLNLGTMAQRGTNEFLGTNDTAVASKSVSVSGFNTNILRSTYVGNMQGIALWGTTNILITTGVVFQQDANWNRGAANFSPWTGLAGLDHNGDGECYNGYLYVPADTYNAGTLLGTNDTLLVFDANTLTRVASPGLSNYINTVSGVAISPSFSNNPTLFEKLGEISNNPTLFAANFHDGTIAQFTLSGVSNITYVRYLPLSLNLTNIQGLSWSPAIGQLVATVDNSAGTVGYAYYINATNGNVTYQGQLNPAGEIEGPDATQDYLVYGNDTTGMFYWINAFGVPSVTTNGIVNGGYADLPKGGVLNPNQVSTNALVDNRVGNTYGWNNYYVANGLNSPFMVFGINGGGGGAFPAWSEGPVRFGIIADQLVLGNSSTITASPAENRKHFSFGSYYGDLGVNNTNPVATVDINQTILTPSWQTRPTVSITPSTGNATNIFQITDTNGAALAGINSNGYFFGNGSLLTGISGGGGTNNPIAAGTNTSFLVSGGTNFVSSDVSHAEVQSALSTATNTSTTIAENIYTSNSLGYITNGQSGVTLSNVTLSDVIGLGTMALADTNDYVSTNALAASVVTTNLTVLGQSQLGKIQNRSIKTAPDSLGEFLYTYFYSGAPFLDTEQEKFFYENGDTAWDFSNGTRNLYGNFIGYGSSLSNLNASQITSGTMPDARLSSHVVIVTNTPTDGDTVVATGPNWKSQAPSGGGGVTTSIAYQYSGTVTIGTAASPLIVPSGVPGNGSIVTFLLPPGTYTNFAAGISQCGSSSGEGSGTNITFICCTNASNTTFPQTALVTSLAGPTTYKSMTISSNVVNSFTLTTWGNFSVMATNNTGATLPSTVIHLSLSRVNQ